MECLGILLNFVFSLWGISDIMIRKSESPKDQDRAGTGSSEIHAISLIANGMFRYFI